MDELTILNQPKTVVLRDGVESEIEASGTVKDDVIVLDAGKQICNDSVVIAGSLEVNESLLTGESASITKTAGAELFSGSSAISGRCYARVTHVGADNYATSLVNEVRQEKRVHSELLDSMRKVTKFTGFLIIPLGIVLFLEATLLRHAMMHDAVVASAAALGIRPHRRTACDFLGDRTEHPRQSPQQQSQPAHLPSRRLIAHRHIATIQRRHMAQSHMPPLYFKDLSIRRTAPQHLPQST